MDRINELNKLMEECDSIPKALSDDNIIRTVKRRAFKHNAAKAARTLAGTIAVLLIVFMVGVNTSHAFSKAVSDIPVLKMLARLVSFNKGYTDAINHKYVTEVFAVGEDDIGTIYVDYVMADERSIVLFSNTKIKDKSKSDARGYFCIERMWDTDTGEEIEFAGFVSMQKEENEEYCVTSLAWDCYHKNVMIEAKYYDPEDDSQGKGNAVICFKTGECLETREYNIYELIDIDGYKYEVTALRMYPMSTEIDVTLLDDVDTDYEQTLDMEFYLQGNNELRKKTDGVTAWLYDNGHKTFVIESGYYVFDDEFVLGLERVDILPREYREVTLDLETGVFTDAFGIVDYWELYDLEAVDGQLVNSLCIKNTKAEEGVMSDFLNSKELDAVIGCGSATDYEDGTVFEYVCLDKDKLDINDGIVTLIRDEAIYIKHPEWETVIR